MARITAFVLAGGKSSRMGTDKAFVDYDGRPLLARTLQIAAQAADDVCIVGRNPRLAEFGRVVPDVFAQRGPLGGIHAALSSTTTELNLVLAVDMPHLESNLLKYLVERANKCEALVTVPRIDGRFEPLCAVYRKGFVEFASVALAENRNKIGALFVATAIEVVTKDELGDEGLSPLMFSNVNTPEELQRVREGSPRRQVKSECHE